MNSTTRLIDFLGIQIGFLCIEVQRLTRARSNPPRTPAEKRANLRFVRDAGAGFPLGFAEGKLVRVTAPGNAILKKHS